MSIINASEDSIQIEFSPKNEKIRKEFLDRCMKGRTLYEDAALKYKDVERTKLYIRKKLREMKYTILHADLDYWDLQFGKGPMFRQVDSKAFVLSFKAIKEHKSSKILGLVVIMLGILVLVLGIIKLLNGFLVGLAGFFFSISIISLGVWISQPITLWIKGVGVAHRVKGKEIVSDLYFQFSGECGFQGMGKIDILREDFDKIFKEVVEYLGEATEESK